MARGVVDLVRDAIEAPPQRDAYHRALIAAERAIADALDALRSDGGGRCGACGRHATRASYDTHPLNGWETVIFYECDEHTKAESDELECAAAVRILTKALAAAEGALR